MLRSVFGRTLWERRTSIVWWIVGLVGLATLTVAFWPTLRDQAGFEELLESLPEGMMALFGASEAAEFLTPTGLVNSRLYASIGSILIVVFCVGAGTRLIAGEEENGTMDLLLAQPLARTRVILEGAAAMVLMVSLLALALLATLFVADPMVHLNLSTEGVIAANVGVVLLGLVHGTLAIAVGSLTGNRGLTIGIASGVVAAGWFVNGLAAIVDELKPVQKVSPFHWFLRGNPLAEGFAFGDLALMAAVAAGLLGVALWGFNRRDLAT